MNYNELIDNVKYLKDKVNQLEDSFSKVRLINDSERRELSQVKEIYKFYAGIEEANTSALIDLSRDVENVRLSKPSLMTKLERGLIKSGVVLAIILGIVGILI